MIGTLHDNTALFLRQDVGSAEVEGHGKFELTTNVGGSTPIIRCEATGKWWTITWKDLVGLAIDAGVAKPD